MGTDMPSHELTAICWHWPCLKTTALSMWKKEMLPIIPDPFKLVVRQIKTEDGYKADPTALKQLEVIRKLLGQADQVISCTDAGREGELIMRYVLEYLGYHKETKRLWISSMTEKLDTGRI